MVIPNEADINQFIADLNGYKNALEKGSVDIVNFYYPQYQELTNDTKDEFMELAEDNVAAAVDMTGDAIKSIWETVEFPNQEAVKLAQADAQSESNNSYGFYAGAAFGVIGLAATLALVSTCDKKAVQENQEALL